MTETLIDNTLLEELLAKAGDSDEASEDFLAHLVESEIYILNGDAATLEDKDDLNILQWEAEDGMMFIPVFTSLEELIRSTEDEKSPCSTINAGELFEVVLGTDVVVNPMNDDSFHVDPEEMEMILSGYAEQDLVVPVPTTDITALKDALSEHLVKQGNILKAALIALADTETKQEHTIIVGVEFSDSALSGDVFDKANAAVLKFVPEGLGLDFIVLDQDAAAEGVEGLILNDGVMLFSKQ